MGAIELTNSVWKEGTINLDNGRTEWFSFTATATTQYIHLKADAVTYVAADMYNTTINATYNNYPIYPYPGIRDNEYFTCNNLTVGHTYYVRMTSQTNQNGRFYVQLSTGVIPTAF